MIATLLFVAFVVLMMVGVPIGAALGLAGAACIALANADAQWFGLLAVPQNFYAGLGVPQWWYSIWLPIVCTAIGLRAMGLFIRRSRQATTEEEQA